MRGGEEVFGIGDDGTGAQASDEVVVRADGAAALGGEEAGEIRAGAAGLGCGKEQGAPSVEKRGVGEALFAGSGFHGELGTWGLMFWM